MGNIWSILWSNQNNDYDDSDTSLSDDDEEIQENTTGNWRNSKDNDSDNELVEDMNDQICLDSATDTMDAAPAASKTITVTLDQVMAVESQMEQYEIVSLVYLLYDDPNSALSYLTSLLNGSPEKLIYNWAIQQNLKNTKWQEKLIEAFCIIQNYEIPKDLGYKKEELVVRFMPHHYNIVTWVNQLRKALYSVCEECGSNDFDILIRLVNADFEKKGLKFKVFPPYLELYLLHWEELGYIKHNNLTSICSVLKQMDMLDLSDKLKELVPEVIPKKAPVKLPVRKTSNCDIQDKILNADISLQDLVGSMSSLMSFDNSKPKSDVCQDEKRKYYMDLEHPGVCLIINQVHFYRDIDENVQHLLPPPETKLEPRKGTEQDKKKLVESFKQFGFRVVTEDNLTHTRITETITEVIRSITNESSFIVCIMSHGDEGIIYGVNSCKVPVKQIKDIMCRKNLTYLQGKPKVLILQSCQGTRCQRISSVEEDDITLDGPSCSTKEAVPPCADLFTFWATVPGYGAIRNKKTGSWFIQSLCDKMLSLSDKCHFEEICTEVVSDVSGMKWKQRTDEVAMVPLKESTFRKKFYLPPIRR